MRKLLKDWFTENDGMSFCPVTALTIFAGIALIFEFLYTHSVDFQGFAIGVSALTAGKAIKTFAEK